MSKDLKQVKAYLGKIDNFDQLYIIQRGGRGITKEQIINRLRKVLNEGKNMEDVFEVIWKNEALRNNVFKGMNDELIFEHFSNMIEQTDSDFYKIIQITK